MSAQNCGCDPEANHVCEAHKKGLWMKAGPGEVIQLMPKVATEQKLDTLIQHYDPSPVLSEASIKQFKSGATRNIDVNKFDYEAFVNPEALHAFGEYMHSHRKQRDGSLRDGDNWQKGIPFRTYVKSLVRHTIDLWRMDRGYDVVNPDTGQPHTKQELCCAIVFNAFGYLKELIDPAGENK